MRPGGGQSFSGGARPFSAPRAFSPPSPRLYAPPRAELWVSHPAPTVIVHETPRVVIHHHIWEPSPPPVIYAGTYHDADPASYGIGRPISGWCWLVFALILVAIVLCFWRTVR